MKHEAKIIGVLLLMFIVTQLIGLAVIDATVSKESKLIEGVEKNVTVSDAPFDFGPPDVEEEHTKSYFWMLIIAFVFAIALFFLLTRLKTSLVIQIWFTIVVFITVIVSIYGLLKFSLGDSLNTSLYAPLKLTTYSLIGLLLAIPLTFYKTIKRNLIVHNFTELLVYPGLAALFVPLLREWSVISLLLIISVYDMWAVWKSKFMIHLAKYQMKNLKMFTGFFVPYLPKKEAKKLEKVKSMKPKSKAYKLAKKGKIQVSLAILGGGDVAFPLIFAGVMLKSGVITHGWIPALLIVAGATIGLAGLFLYSKKGKFYPAMPFITAGCLAGWLISFLF